MFQQEAIALRIIAQTNTIKTPKVIDVASFENENYVLMEFIDSKTPSPQDQHLLGKQLAQLHQTSSNYFGFEFDNFIGSLPQNNNSHDNWTDFYIEERLAPQIKMAINKGSFLPSEAPSIQLMKSNTSKYFNTVKPSLLHGDLWSGNYLIASNGTPYLIDPATYYGHSEVDIAMSLLFGGFSNAFYETYHQIIPRDSYTETRIELYQLYYLLVHLNLFGSSYYNSVKRILNKYF
jgi:fructosamine-3-kinase